MLCKRPQKQHFWISADCRNSFFTVHLFKIVRRTVNQTLMKKTTVDLGGQATNTWKQLRGEYCQKRQKTQQKICWNQLIFNKSLFNVSPGWIPRGNQRWTALFHSCDIFQRWFREHDKPQRWSALFQSWSALIFSESVLFTTEKFRAVSELNSAVSERNSSESALIFSALNIGFSALNSAENGNFQS